MTSDPVKSGTRRALFSPGNLALIMGVVTVIVAVASQMLHDTQEPLIGGPAPSFSLTTLNGDHFDLAQQRGHVVVVNFWASWCGPCREETPALQEVYTRYRAQGVRFIGVTFRDEEADTRAFMDLHSITFPNGPDTELNIARRYDVTGAPETFIVDQNGDVAAVFRGPLAPYSPFNIADLTAVLDELIEEPA